MKLNYNCPSGGKLKIEIMLPLQGSGHRINLCKVVEYNS